MELLRQMPKSRFALLLFCLHSALAIHVVISKPPTGNSQELIDCRTMALAGRAIHIPSEPSLVRALGWLDLPAIAAYYVIWVSLYLVIDVFQLSVSINAMSWVNAAI